MFLYSSMRGDSSTYHSFTVLSSCVKPTFSHLHLLSTLVTFAKVAEKWIIFYSERVVLCALFMNAHLLAF